MIKILSGWGGLGGSTVAFNNLVNLFNKNDMNAKFYTPDRWEGITCSWDSYDNINLSSEDILIYHFMRIDNKIPVKRVILSCHETNLFPIKDMNGLAYDKIQFVSDFQKNWHGVDGVVIPNVIARYARNKTATNEKVAGIIGSIDPHKGVHESIKRALTDEDVNKVLIYGSISDFNYFSNEVQPLLSSKVAYCGVSKNMQEVYDDIDVVYSSSQRECLPMIQGECLRMGIEYRGLSENTREETDYEFNDEVILDKWKKLLY
ncbi:MAG: hypothetical protein CL605_13410 [Altibacter sp.]|uniref:hypothetical protein n=1 Tax=Altibacter sp. TaxID=2024823 RepID=UPI000C938A93|nr:hypothetical protein [Altibacter sp.]MAP55891.1 hypothetical protein [Altibacter sp.]